MRARYEKEKEQSICVAETHGRKLIELAPIAYSRLLSIGK